MPVLVSGFLFCDPGVLRFSPLYAILMMIKGFWLIQAFGWVGVALSDTCCVPQHDSAYLQVTESYTFCAASSQKAK